MPNTPLIGCRVPHGYFHSYRRGRGRDLIKNFVFSVQNANINYFRNVKKIIVVDYVSERFLRQKVFLS